MKSNGTWLMLQVCLAVMLLTGTLVQEVAASPVLGLQKRESRRIPRARYRGGYMFGKRASQSQSSSSKLVDAITNRLLSDSELASILQKDPETLLKVAAIIDKDNDGYISMSDFL